MQALILEDIPTGAAERHMRRAAFETYFWRIADELVVCHSVRGSDRHLYRRDHDAGYSEGYVFSGYRDLV